MPTTPTPADLRELAGRADQLAADIGAVRDRMRASGDDATARAAWPLDEIGADVAAAAAGLGEAADGLARVRVAADPAICGIPWGVCPEHGNTLASSGGQTCCRTCQRRWSFNRQHGPCTEPISHRVVDAQGTESLMCQGHAQDASDTLVGSTVMTLDRPAP
jgi:hypothetical protein